MCDIAFLILHYNVVQETINCVNSIVDNIDSNNYNIVIVDNGSPNKSGGTLLEHFKNNSKVHVIINDTNLGFAKGNNVGFKYIKDTLNPNYIVMTNNDTILKQKDFFSKIVSLYNKYNFSVLGPKVILPNSDISSSPMYLRLQSREEIEKSLKKIKLFYVLSFINADELLRGIYQKIKPKSSKSVSTIDHNSNIENCVLHGCCLIFSKKYIDLFDGLNDKTFLYREEEILYIRLMKHNLKSLYSNEVEIYHLEDVATNSMFSKPKKYRTFKYKHLIRSTQVLLNELNS